MHKCSLVQPQSSHALKTPTFTLNRVIVCISNKPEKTRVDQTFTAEERGGGAVCEEGWEPGGVHRVHRRGLTHSSPSRSDSPSLSTVVDLNNLSHIIYLPTSISFTLTRTHSHTRTQLSPSPHKHTYTHASGGWVLGMVWSEQAGICTQGNLIGVPCAKHMRSP